MKACRTASVVAFGALAFAGAMGACRESLPPVDVPPPTMARPPAPGDHDAAVAADAAPAPGAAFDGGSAPPRVRVRFLEGTNHLEPSACGELFVAAVRGAVRVENETLAPWDILAVTYPTPTEVRVPPNGLAVAVTRDEQDCNRPSRPPEKRTRVRADAAPALLWAGGKMSAHLDVGSKVSPNLYLGRLEGSAGVVEHDHPHSAEVLVAIEAAGTFTIDGKAERLGPRQVVIVPRGARHSWSPDPGSKLVALQIYDPPGPEQRFIGLAAAEAAARDGGVAGKR